MLSLLWLESPPWLGFDPWPGNFCMPPAPPKQNGGEINHEINHFKVSTSVVFSISMILCSHHPNLIIEHCCHSSKKPCARYAVTPFPPSPRPLATNLRPVLIDGHILDISYKRSRTIRGLLCLALSHCVMFWRLIHAVDSAHQGFSPFYSC